MLSFNFFVFYVFLTRVLIVLYLFPLA